MMEKFIRDPNDWGCDCEFCTESDGCNELDGCLCYSCKPDIPEDIDE